MSRFSDMIAKEQARRGLTDHAAAVELGVKQQNFSSWKNGTVPRPNRHAAIAAWLGISAETMHELAAEAGSGSIARTKVPKITGANVRTYGRVSDRKDGKFRFDPIPPSGLRVPAGRYAVEVGTNVMEPALLYGTKIWLDPSVWPQVGNEVLVHSVGGHAWLGRLVEMENGTAEISRNVGRLTVRDVQAVHVVVLAERVPG